MAEVELARYSIFNGQESIHTEEDEDGDWVKWDDAQAKIESLMDENARLEEEIDVWRSNWPNDLKQPA